MCFQGVLKVLKLLTWLVPVLSGNSVHYRLFFPDFANSKFELLEGRKKVAGKERHSVGR